MSRSVWCCRHCRQPLGHRHHSGRLQALPGVTVFFDPHGRFGPFVRLICPGCGHHRDYLDGAVVVRAAIAAPVTEGPALGRGP